MREHWEKKEEEVLLLKQELKRLKVLHAYDSKIRRNT